MFNLKKEEKLNNDHAFEMIDRIIRKNQPKDMMEVGSPEDSETFYMEAILRRLQYAEWFKEFEDNIDGHYNR